MKLNQRTLVLTLTLIGGLGAHQAMAAIALDRTRVVFGGDVTSVSMSINNENKQQPYLAQGWLEDAQGNKTAGPLVVLPPVQRLEPGAHSQIQVRALPAVSQLAQDRETLFYFNLREIPPRSSQANTLQIALQTRIKLFYRPRAIVTDVANLGQEKLTLTRQGDRFVAINPTPYFVSLVDATAAPDGKTLSGFTAVMVPPRGQVSLGVSAASAGASPVLTYINDFGGHTPLHFHCAGPTCKVQAEKY